VPLASTASRPSTISRVMPKRSTRLPPALVDAFPPSVALPRAPRSSGNANPCSSAASCSCCSVTPAWTTATRCSGSIDSILRIRSSERTTSVRAVSVPCTSPVRPPCTITGWPAALHNANAVDTSPVLAGRSSSVERIGRRCIQSSVRPARPSPASSASGGSASFSRAMRLGSIIAVPLGSSCNSAGNGIGGRKARAATAGSKPTPSPPQRRERPFPAPFALDQVPDRACN